MMYQKSVCDLYLVGADSEAWRFNLEQGQFLQGIQTNLTEINVCDVNPAHELLGFGGTNDCVEFYDPRDRACISRTVISESVSRAGELSKLSDKIRGSEITSLRFDNDGLTYACGTDTGHVFFMIFELVLL
jgi:ribosome biogenesis protein ENP2